MGPKDNRDELWDQIAGPWDVLIVGGGIVGVGLLREAARAGLNTLLIEADDFASGTSSRSSKMVHGGLRYLSSGKIKLTMDSVHERQRLLNQGRGLVDPLEILLVSYKGDHMPAWVFNMGLMIYDTLALKWEHQLENTEAVEALCPQVKRTNLACGFRFFDAQTDDARLVFRVLQEGLRAGGKAINYVRAEGLLRERGGRVCGAQAHDLVHERKSEVRASVVINATGAWSDELRALVGQPPRLRRLRGSHLIFPRHKFPINKEISFFHPEDHRPVFAFPWEGVTLVGTTDVDHLDPLETDPHISVPEVEYLMTAVNHLFDCLDLKYEDVQSTLAGIRSVLNTGKKNPSKESRDEVLWNEDGLVTITGGKLTMFRHMAQKTIQFIQQFLPTHLPLNRHARVLDQLDEAKFSSLAAKFGLDPMLQLRLLGRYGHNAPQLIHEAKSDDLMPVSGTKTLWTELRWAARHEAVVHLDDLLLRRTRLGLILPSGAMCEMDRIRTICQDALGWDDLHWQAEEAAYRLLWNRSYRPPGLASAAQVE